MDDLYKRGMGINGKLAEFPVTVVVIHKDLLLANYCFCGRKEMDGMVVKFLGRCRDESF